MIRVRRGKTGLGVVLGREMLFFRGEIIANGTGLVSLCLDHTFTWSTDYNCMFDTGETIAAFAGRENGDSLSLTFTHYDFHHRQPTEFFPAVSNM